MGLNSICFKKAYSSDCDDVLNEFFIPALSCAFRYDRLAGFFSSSSLAVAAQGILSFIKNDGMMRLITSVRLAKADLDMIQKVLSGTEEAIITTMMLEINTFENEFIRNHVRALGWMLANNRLEIKVAVPLLESGLVVPPEIVMEGSMFHQKVGILRDNDGNIASFSGSVNETATGWLGNIEEFKVFCSWNEIENQYVRSDINTFERLWGNKSYKVKVIEIPSAVREHLIQIAPNSLDELNLERWQKKPTLKKKNLFTHQKEALSQWINNDMKGILEMATGSGKTVAAMGCIEEVQRKHEKIIIILACPQSHLLHQWGREIEIFGLQFDGTIVVDSNTPKWRDKLADLIMDVNMKYKNKILIMTTHRTLASKDFRNITINCGTDIPFMLVGDEVHGMGAAKNREGLLDNYTYRLGLSATVERQFDEVGTQAIRDYFGDVVFEFGLNHAINTINPDTGFSYLTPFTYIPSFVSLSEYELQDYWEITASIVRLSNQRTNDEASLMRLENLLFKRADIVKNAEDKYEQLEQVLDQLSRDLKWTIIYCSPQQIERVMSIVGRRNIKVHRFTMDEGTKPSTTYGGMSERDYVLQHFGLGNYQVLVAMKCLDEGVDVPPARTMILMASSGNRREYIQRIGRVIRRYPGKLEANVIDIVAIPSDGNIPEEFKATELRIFEKELNRYEEIASYSSNPSESMTLICEISRRMIGG